MKSLTVHLALFALSSALALRVWTRADEEDKPRAEMVEVWGGAAESVEAVSYETEGRKVRLEAKKDAGGRYYVARMEKHNVPAVPHGHPPTSTPPASGTQKLAFVGVEAAGELVEKLAPFSALRALGKVPAPRLADFGLDKPEGTLKVRAAGKEHVLSIGASTPGATERYAKYGASGEVFAIPGDVLQSLEFADSRLMQRDLHGFEMDQVTRITLTKGDKKRELVRLADKKQGWADASSPTKPDETVINWMTKLARVRVTEYVENPSAKPRPEDAVVRVEYFADRKSLGFFELYKGSGQPGEPKYLGRSNLTRWFVEVVASAAEQVDQDSGALFK